MKSFYSLLLTLLVCPFVLSAQDTLKESKYEMLNHYNSYGLNEVYENGFDYRHQSNYVGVNFSFGHNSNAVSSGLAYNFISNGYIDSTKKEKVYAQLQGKNKYEDRLISGLTYAHVISSKKEEEKYLLYFKYAYNNERNILFTNDALQIALSGNKRFEDDTAVLGKTQLTSLAWNQYGIGFSKLCYKPNFHIYWGITASLLSSPQYNSLKLEDSYLYTAELGEYLDVKYNIDFRQVDPGAPEFFSFKGTGFLADAHLSYGKPNNYSIRFSAENLGFIKYKKEVNRYAGDSSIHFEGIDVMGLNSFGGSGFSNFNADSLFTILSIQKSTESFTYTLPFAMNLSFHKALFAQQGMLSIGLNYRYLPQYYPFFWTKYMHGFKRNYMLGGSLAFGGYTKFNIGVEAGKEWKNFRVNVGSNSLFGFFMPKTYTSSSLYVRVAATF